MSPSIARALSTILGWLFAVVGIVAAWFQSVVMFQSFVGAHSPEWWPYLAATMIEGCIVYGALVLMSRAESWAGAIAIILFIVNTLISMIDQVIAASLSDGAKLDSSIQMLVVYVLPASVTFLTSLLWLGEITKSRAGEHGQDDQRSPKKKSGGGVLSWFRSAINEPDQQPGAVKTFASESPSKTMKVVKTKKAKARARRKANG